jgi:hypothetical protein
MASKKQLQSLEINGELFFKIAQSDRLRPFLMSIVSASNHWMFIGSNGGLTAGRKNAEYALFPYYSDDKIIESVEITGPKTIVQLEIAGQLMNWEPFSQFGREQFELTTNLYKNQYGNKVAFEEINETLGLSFRYEWSSSDQYGFVRRSRLTNTGQEDRTIRLIDGLQNILPYGVGSDLQMKQSNLVDAYKRNELDIKSGLGIFALSAIIVDRAEPSEALKANVVWQRGLEVDHYLLSAKQLPAFKSGKSTRQETDIKAEKGAFLVQSNFELNAGEDKRWITVADVNKNHPFVANLIKDITTQGIEERVNADIALGTEELINLTAAADGLQQTADKLKDTRHFANVMFNIMRGGIFDHNYQIEKWDLLQYLQSSNRAVYNAHHKAIEALNDECSLQDLAVLATSAEDPSFTRLLSEYLPLKFSRRHGDPSRPWNKFSINTRNEDDGSKILDYQGNWRDIFQNWEALAFAYPQFMEGMIFRFLNASTFDGYNPYRIMKYGFDWEVIEPDDPWSYIGYWGDHQIIYLLKFLEFMEKHQPGRLKQLLDQRTFAYAAVPYKIKDYAEILKNPKDTIIFDHDWDEKIRKTRDKVGADGALLKDKVGQVYHVNFLEKILATTLAKITNLIPDAGIWMNTQRPEWNDANNALVGNGVSMVTLYYLRRFLSFFENILDDDDAEIEVSAELVKLFKATQEALLAHQEDLETGFSDRARKSLMDTLGEAASDFRNGIYAEGFSTQQAKLSLQEVDALYRLSNQYLEASIDSNERADHLFHAYNIIEIGEEEVSVSHLDEMLEGQVAVLSSGYLSAEQALQLMDALKSSQLYRVDQHSYILYPNKELKGFLDRNQVPAEAVKRSRLLQELVNDQDVTVIERDVDGVNHFHGAIRNGFELGKALDQLDDKYATHLSVERELIQSIYEEVFNHKTFTGRSGTFYGYEGLGSIYWHMVSKLLLAVEECTIDAIKKSEQTADALIAHGREVFEGIGVHKSPKVYGAFPIDPYSHTPFTKGAQQPGMTGQVKEDVISRLLELGVEVNEGKISFLPALLDHSEFIKEASDFHYVDINGASQRIALPANALAFTYCQVPIVYHQEDRHEIKVTLSSGDVRVIAGHELDRTWSEMIFSRNGQISTIEVIL